MCTVAIVENLVGKTSTGAIIVIYHGSIAAGIAANCPTAYRFRWVYRVPWTALVVDEVVGAAT